MKRFSLFLLLAAALGALSLAGPARAQNAPSSFSGTEPASFAELTTGERLGGRVELREPFLKGRYLMLRDTLRGTSMRLGLDSVRAFRTEDGYFRRVGGKRGQGAFARRVGQGRIDLFERTETLPGSGSFHMAPGSASGGAPQFSPGGLRLGRASYFAVGQGPLRPVEHGALREALADSPESMRHLRQYRTLGYVQYGLVGAGLGIVAAGATQIEEGGGVPTLIIAGAAVAATSWTPHLLRPQKLRAAIRAYNR